jgi:hypothetical protein
MSRRNKLNENFIVVRKNIENNLNNIIIVYFDTYGSQLTQNDYDFLQIRLHAEILSHMKSSKLIMEIDFFDHIFYFIEIL